MNKGSTTDINPYRFMKLSSRDKTKVVFRVWSGYTRSYKNVVLDKPRIEQRIVMLAGRGLIFEEEEKALAALGD